MLYVSAAYSYCIVIEAPAKTATCGRKGPGSTTIPGVPVDLLLYPFFVGFFLQIILVWIALYLLKWSLPKGGAVRRGVRLIGDRVYWKERRNMDCGPPGTPLPSDDDVLTKQAPRRSQRTERRFGKVVGYDRSTGLHAVEIELPQTPPTATVTNELDFDVDIEKGRGLQAAVPVVTTAVVVENVRLHDMRYFVVSKSGPLRHLLFYDLVSFFVVCVLTGLLVVVSHETGRLKHGWKIRWQIRSALICAQIGYSLCALPFVIASISPWKWVFTHARDTGYTKNGVCVPIVEPHDFAWVVNPTAEMEVHSTLRSYRRKDATSVRSTAPVTGDGPAIVESRKKTTKIMPQVKKQKKHSSVKMKKKEIPEIKRNTPTRSFHRYIEDGGGISDECDVGEIALSHNSQVEDI